MKWKHFAMFLFSAPFAGSPLFPAYNLQNILLQYLQSERRPSCGRERTPASNITIIVCVRSQEHSGIYHSLYCRPQLENIVLTCMPTFACRQKKKNGRGKKMPRSNHENKKSCQLYQDAVSVAPQPPTPISKACAKQNDKTVLKDCSWYLYRWGKQNRARDCECCDSDTGVGAFTQARVVLLLSKHMTALSASSSTGCSLQHISHKTRP